VDTPWSVEYTPTWRADEKVVFSTTLEKPDVLRTRVERPLDIDAVRSLKESRITLPMPEPDRNYLRQVRRGEVGLDEVIIQVDQAAEHLAALRDASDLPAEPDRGWVDEWLHRSHLSYWSD
jgi:hypothetical protein